MEYIFSCFFLLSTYLSLSAQATSVFDILDLEPEGCTLSVESGIQRMEAMIDASPVPPTSVELPEGINTVDDLFLQLGSWVSSQVEIQPALQEAKIVFDEEYTFFRNGQLWGLRKQEDILLHPQFDHIELTDTKDGFIAYKGATANFYDITGNAQFPDYYHGISQAKEGQFIVYTPQGAGLVSANGEVLLRPEYEQINLFSNQQAPYYHVQSNRKTSFLYAIETGERIYYNASHHEWNFLNKRYARIGNRDLIDLQEKKRIFCGQEVNIQVLSTEQQLLSIALSKQPNRRYCVRFDGRLVSTDPYYEIRNYYPEGYLVAALPKPYQQGDRQKMLFGIIDTLGNWVLPAEYDQFSGTMVAGEYFQLSNQQGEATLINNKGDILFPFQRYPRFAFNEEKKSLEMYYEEGGQAVGLRHNLKNGKLTTIKERVYLSKRPYMICDKDGYTVASTGQGEVLLDPKGKPVLKQTYKRIFTGDFDNTFITKKATPPGGSMFGPYRQLHNCDGSLRSFQVDGQTVTNFYDLFVIEEDFYFLKNDLESGHFLFPDGSSMYSPYGWRQVIQRLDGHYILNAAGNEMGIITKDGIVVLPPSFEILYFRKDLGLLKAQLTEDNIQWIKPNGELLFGGQYDSVRYDKAGKFKVKKGSLTGIADSSGELIIPISYANLYYAKGFYHAKDSDGNKYRFDRNGKPMD